jgi:hypothetical protein
MVLIEFDRHPWEGASVHARRFGWGPGYFGLRWGGRPTATHGRHRRHTFPHRSPRPRGESASSSQVFTVLSR